MEATGHVLVAGGGSAGHVFPGLAVAEALDERGWSASWLGRPRGMERDLVTGRGMTYHPLPARALVGRGVGARLAALSVTGISAVRARSLVRRRGIDAVLGTGSYVSAAAVLGGRLAGRPAFLLEPNAAVGTANRLLARWATEVFLGFADTARGLDAPSRHTGIPVRSEFFPAAPLPAGPPRLLILGGSQGARQINELVPAALQRLGEAADGLQVVHQCGAAHQEAVERDYGARGLGGGAVSSNRLGLRVVRFIDDVAAEMAAAHLVISRAGALTLAEICAAGRPSILLPLELAAGHQRANAERMVSAGAAELAAGDAAEPETMAGLLAALLADRPRLEAMAGAASGLARPEAAEEIAEAIVARVLEERGDG